MRTLLIALLLSAVAAAPATAAERTIRIGDDWYVREGEPPTVKVAKGTVVRWRWTGRNEHDVTVKRGPRRFHSKIQDSGTFRRTLRRSGRYRIACSIHGPAMRMTLRVKA